MRKIVLLSVIFMSAFCLTGCINNQAINTLNESAKGLLEKGDAQGAVCRLESSLELDNTKYQTRYNLGVAYIQLGDLERAKENLERVIEMKSDYPDAYYSLGVAYENSAYNIINQVAQIALDSDVSDQNEDTALSDDKKENVIAELNEAIKYYNIYVEKSNDKESVEEVKNQIGNIQRTIEKYQVEAEDEESSN